MRNHLTKHMIQLRNSSGYDRSVSVVILTGMILLLSACAGSARMATVSPIGDDRDWTADEVIERLPEFPEALHRAFAEAQVALSSPAEKGRFSAKISFEHPAHVFVRVTFPLGIEGARVLANADTAWVYDRVEEVVYFGSPERIQAVLPGAVPDAHIMEYATGLNRPSIDRDWTVERDSTLLLLHAADGLTRLTVDPSIWRIVSVRDSDADGTVLEQRWFADFVEMEGTLLPRRMTLTRPPEELRMSMALRRLESQPDGLTFDLDVDPNTQWIDLGR